jgi:formiminoglutamase
MQNPYLTLPTLLFSPSKGDPHVNRLCDWISPGEWEANISIVGVPLSKSSISFSGAHSHPAAFRQLWTSFQSYHWDDDIDFAHKLEAVDMGDVSMHVTDILQCHDNIRNAAQHLWTHFPNTTAIFVGGDHSITYPIISGLAAATQKRIGLIHFDAHLDVRDTEYGGPSNGTPMRSLIVKGVLQGENMVTLGLRSYANSKHYRTYAEEKGMQLFSANQVRERGVETLVHWAMEYLDSRVDLVYVTFDIDVMDQSFVPGVPAMGPGGLTPRDLFTAAKTLGKWNKVAGMDMVCVDPTRDVRDMSTRVSLHVFLEFVAGMCARQ